MMTSLPSFVLMTLFAVMVLLSSTVAASTVRIPTVNMYFQCGEEGHDLESIDWDEAVQSHYEAVLLTEVTSIDILDSITVQSRQCFDHDEHQFRISIRGGAAEYPDSPSVSASSMDISTILSGQMDELLEVLSAACFDDELDAVHYRIIVGDDDLNAGGVSDELGTTSWTSRICEFARIGNVEETSTDDDFVFNTVVILAIGGAVLMLLACGLAILCCSELFRCICCE